MNDNQKCICTGPICDCGAHGIVKDGAGVRVSAHMMDSATGQLLVDGITIDRATFDAYLASPERAYDQSKHSATYGHLGDNAPPFDGDVACRALADRIRHNQRNQATIDHYTAVAANPGLYAHDGRLMADLTPSDLAREKMIADMNSWR